MVFFNFIQFLSALFCLNKQYWYSLFSDLDNFKLRCDVLVSWETHLLFSSEFILEFSDTFPLILDFLSLFLLKFAHQAVCSRVFLLKSWVWFQLILKWWFSNVHLAALSWHRFTGFEVSHALQDGTSRLTTGWFHAATSIALVSLQCTILIVDWKLIIGLLLRHQVELVSNLSLSFSISHCSVGFLLHVAGAPVAVFTVQTVVVVIRMECDVKVLATWIICKLVIMRHLGRCVHWQEVLLLHHLELVFLHLRDVSAVGVCYVFFSSAQVDAACLNEWRMIFSNWCSSLIDNEREGRVWAYVLLCFLAIIAKLS